MARFCPGDLVEALEGCHLEGVVSPGDQGTVHSCEQDGATMRIQVVWASFGKATRLAGSPPNVRFLRKQVLEAGDVLEALPGTEVQSERGELYRHGDHGIVETIMPAADGNTAFARVLWTRTDKVCDIPLDTWMSFCSVATKNEAFQPGMVVRIHSMKGAKELNGQLATCQQYNEEKCRWLVRLTKGDEDKLIKPENLRPDIAEPDLQIGDLLQALPDNPGSPGFYGRGDQGTVLAVARDAVGDRAQVVWASSGKVLSSAVAGWTTSYALIAKQSLSEGDLVEALPGQNLVVDGLELYVAGDQGVVHGFGASEAAAEPQVRIIWSRTGQASDLPRASWMRVFRLVEKGDPTKAKTPAAAAAANQPAPKVAALLEGVVARIQGLLAAPELNGAKVKLVRYEPTKSRWLVTVVTDEELVEPIEKWLKPVNLKPISF